MEIGEYTLTPQQELGVLHLLELKHAVLSFRPGKGKTLPAIYAAKEFCGNTGRCLIISKKLIIEKMWEVDIVPLKILPPKTTFMNTELMNVNDAVYDTLLQVKWDCVIVDECHLLKNPTSVQSKRIHKLCEKVPLVIGLTGTPRCNSDEDLYGIMRALHIGNFGKIRKTEFEREFGIRTLKQFGGHSFYKFEGIKPELKEWWDTKIAKYFLMADYEEGEMPPLVINKKIIPFVKTEEYTKALKGVINLPEFATTFQKCVAVQKAQQAANGFMYLEDEKVYKVPNYKADKMNNMVELINKTPEKKRIIVYRFTEDKNQLLATFGNKVTDDQGLFKTGKCNILLMQAQQGVGVNLQTVDEIHFYTMDVSFVNYEQMIHRAWRTGRTTEVNIYIWLYEGTVEEKIWASVCEKKAIGDLLFSIKKELSL